MPPRRSWRRSTSCARSWRPRPFGRSGLVAGLRAHARRLRGVLQPAAHRALRHVPALLLPPSVVAGARVGILPARFPSKRCRLTGLLGIYEHPYRLFDVDDLIVNTLGAMVGFWLVGPALRVLPDMRLVKCRGARGRRARQRHAARPLVRHRPRAGAAGRWRRVPSGGAGRRGWERRFSKATSHGTRPPRRPRRCRSLCSSSRCQRSRADRRSGRSSCACASCAPTPARPAGTSTRGATGFCSCSRMGALRGAVRADGPRPLHGVGGGRSGGVRRLPPAGARLGMAGVHGRLGRDACRAGAALGLAQASLRRCLTGFRAIPA